MPRTIVMGNPKYFSVVGGANPHTRNFFGMKKHADPELAREQWHSLAKALIAHGAEVLVIEPHQNLPGLVYPANAGFLFPLNGGNREKKTFYLSNLIATRALERNIYGEFVTGMGYETQDIQARFEGEADFFPAGELMMFTHGRIERQRFRFRIGIPPWKRIYGFRSEGAAYWELSHGLTLPTRQILPLTLCLETHYHGDTALCSFGPQRKFLLAYLPGLSEKSRKRLREHFGNRIVELSDQDAACYAANSFQIEHEGKLYLMMPEGVSGDLVMKISELGVEPILVNVSEFLKKGGGSVKCMILDIGPSEEQPQNPAAVAFRDSHKYTNLF